MAEVVVGQPLKQLVILIPAPESGGGLFVGDKGGFCHVVQRQDNLLHGPGLVLREGLVHKGQHLILGFHLRQHGVGVHRHQSKGAHNQQTGYRDAHGGKGHEAVAEHVESALFDKVEKVVLVHSVFLP